jgi:hypothetical protein
MEQVRQCTICGEEKSFSNFSVLKSGKYGRHPHCKQCRSKQRRGFNYPKPLSGRNFCPRCQTEKDVSEFSGDKSSKSGLQTYCKLCHAKITSIRECTLDGFINIIYRELKYNARNRNKEFRITKDDIKELYEKQQGNCAVSGVKMTHIRNTGDGRCKNPRNISVDRIDSSKGYTKDNIQLICSAANTIKWDLDQEEFFAICELITNYQHSKKMSSNVELIFHDYIPDEN